MAGRTLQQAMAYLGLAEQAEPAPQPSRSAHGEEYREDLYRDDFDERDVFAEESEVAYDTQPVSEEHFLQAERPRRTADPSADFYAEEETYAEPLAPIIEPQKASSQRVKAEPKARVRPSQTVSNIHESEDELRRITTIHPRSYNDAKIIGESFRENIPVIMNVTDMGESEAKRLVDFSAGLAFALHGSIERVTDKVFLLTPANLEVLGAEGAEVPVALDSDPSDLFNQG